MGPDPGEEMNFMSEPTWKREPIKGSTTCATCGCGSHDTFDMESVIAVGFGSAGVTRDGHGVWDEGEAEHEARETGKEAMLWQGKDAEEAAAKDPDHDWRIYMFAPLYEAEYQRHSAGHWVLISKGLGFA